MIWAPKAEPAVYGKIGRTVMSGPIRMTIEAAVPDKRSTPLPRKPTSNARADHRTACSPSTGIGFGTFFLRSPNCLTALRCR